MKSHIRDRWITAFAIALVAGVGGTVIPPATAQTTGRIVPPLVSDTLAQLERQPDRIVRVVVSVKHGTVDQVAAAAADAGANSVNPLYATDSVIIEGTAAHVRAAIATGQVLQLRRNGGSNN